LKLSKHQWRFTDLIGRYHPGSESLGTSRYVGVRRSTEFTWIAWKSGVGKNYIGSFKSEQDAAFAHDFYARKLGGSVNFPDERIGEEEISLRQIKRYRTDVALPTRGKSKYRGIHWQKNRKRWMARYTFTHRGEKNINLGSFSEARQAASAFDAEARKRGRPDSHLNFLFEHSTEAQSSPFYLFSLRNSQVMASLRGVSSLPPTTTTLLNILKTTTLQN
jgi:hypothetical protein